MLESLNLYTCIFAFLNFIILFLVVKKFLFKPVMDYMNARQEEVANTISAAETANADAEELKAQYEARLQSAKADGQKIIDEMTARANHYYDTTVAKADEEGRNILARAKEDSEREHQKILQESKAEIAGLALAAASKVMRANMDTEANRKIIDEFLEETGVA